MIANVINTFDLDYVLPVSLVDESMKRAHNRDGLLQTKFWWKIPACPDPQATRIASLQESQFTRSSQPQSQQHSSSESEEQEQTEDASRYQELYIWQILNGDESIGYSKGLISLCEEYMMLN